MQPTGLQALTVIMYRVDGVRPRSTPGEEESMNVRQGGRQRTQTQGTQTEELLFKRDCKFGRYPLDFANSDSEA